MKIDARNSVHGPLIGLVEATLDGKIVRECVAADDSAGWVEVAYRPYRIKNDEALTYRKYGSVRIRFRRKEVKDFLASRGFINRRLRNLFAAPAGDEA